LSLLLDALKRAEQEKLARGGSSETPAPPPPREPAARATPPVAPNLELQPITGGATLGAAPRPDAGVHAAQVVFQAKAANAPGQRSRGMLWATIGAVAVVAIAAGAYVWYSVSALTPARVVQRVRPAPLPQAPAGSVPMQQPAAETALAAASRERAATNDVAPAPAPAPAPAATGARPIESAVERLLRESAAAPAPPPLRLDRSAAAAPRVPAEVSAGYDALRRGNLAAARRSYEAAIASDPVNVDARLGLATIDARSGNRSSAATHYRRVLDLDPRNATALAGLAALADFARPEAIEAQLVADLARSPDSPALRFTLGNLYASQSRWREAQSQYFEAHRLDPGNGDVLYNLAVSLDQLGQTRVAAEYYRRALEAARDQGAQFDPAPVARRMAEIR
jgi:tetratricopeptide (TPR) repeat protein